MKKSCLLILMLLAAASFLFGCAKPPSETLGKGDKEIAENSRINLNNTNVVRSGDILYFNTKLDGSSGAFLFAADLKTGEAMPVCGKPDCMHNSSECNAHLNVSGAKNLIAYNDRIYWCERKNGFYLCGMKADGTDRFDALQLDTDYELAMGAGFAGIYDNKLYRFGSGWDVSEGDAKNITLAYCQTIEKDSKPVEIMRFDGGDSVISRMHEHMLYCASFAYHFGETESDEATIMLKLNAYDMDSGELKELHNGEVDFSAQDLFVKGNELIFHGLDTVTSYSFETGKFTRLCFEPEKEYYYDASDDAVFIFTAMNEYLCQDYAGNTLSEGAFLPDGLEDEYAKAYLGSIDGTFYYYLRSDTKPMRHYLVSFDPKTSEIKLLWKGENKGRQW